MPAPALTLSHLKTSKLYKGTQLVNRYWFQWQDRTNLASFVIRLELLDEDGNKVTESNIQLPKTKITGYVPETETDPQRPMYDIPVFIQIDDIPRDKPAVSFRYRTVTGLFNKSEQVTGDMTGLLEDLSMYL